MARQQQQASKELLWEHLGKAEGIVRALGYDHLPADHNPVWEAVAGLDPLTDEEIDELVEAGEMAWEEADGLREATDRGSEMADSLRPLMWRGTSPNKSGIFQAYVLAQTAVLNSMRGPIGNGSLGTIRQRWYFAKSSRAMGFKYIAQACEKYWVKTADVVLVGDAEAEIRARRLGVKEIIYKREWTKTAQADWQIAHGRKPQVHIWPKSGWGRVYSQLQSGLFGNLVLDGLLYEHLWVRDASRKVETSYPLLQDFFSVLVIEKEGLYEHMAPLVKAAGVKVLVAASGNNAFSVIEMVLNDNFRDYEGSYKPSPANPLHLFVISDHDYYGHVPVQDGVVAQFERYLPGAVEKHRVGITPEQVRQAGKSPARVGYEFDVKRNSATEEWAGDEGIWVGDVCYAIEVEALEPGQYVADLVAAIVEAVGGDEELARRLAKAAQPDWNEVERRLREDLLAGSELLARLLALKKWSDDTREDCSSDLYYMPGNEWVTKEWQEQAEVIEAVTKAVQAEAEKVDRESFAQFVKQGSSWSAYQPVSNDQATDAVAGLAQEAFEEDAAAVAADLDDDYSSLLETLREVFDVLSGFDLKFES